MFAPPQNGHGFRLYFLFVISNHLSSQGLQFGRFRVHFPHKVSHLYSFWIFRSEWSVIAGCGFATLRAFHFGNNVLVKVGVVVPPPLVSIPTMLTFINSAEVAAVLACYFLYLHGFLFHKYRLFGSSIWSIVHIGQKIAARIQNMPLIIRIVHLL